MRQPASRLSAISRASASPEGYVLPPTPPPDIDLELWRASADADSAVVAVHTFSDATSAR